MKLGIAHDPVRAEVPQVVGLLLRRHALERADWSRASRSTLVEQEDAVVLEGTLEPRRAARLERTRGLKPGPTLEEHEPGKVVIGAAARDDLAREHRERETVRTFVVDRQLELVLGENEPWRTMRCLAHRASMSASSTRSQCVAMPTTDTAASRARPSAIGRRFRR